MHRLRPGDPERIGDYALLARLGSGAMGAVYLALSRGGRPIAVKVVRAELGDDAGFRERFRREVEAVRSVGGFWTAAVVDADPGAAQPWLATEYVPGPSLQEAVASRGPLPADGLRYLAGGLAEALAAIHAAGVLHRDLKPANVLLGPNGPRVIDFGISRALAGSTLTAAGLFLGTPGYLSPEQITGAPVGPPSDVYALGGVLTFAATGHGPFGDGPAATLVDRALKGEPDLGAVAQPLRGLIAACLQRDPSRRPDPAGVLAALGPAGAPAEGWLPPEIAALVEAHRTRLLETAGARGPSLTAALAPPSGPPPTTPDRAAQPAPAAAPASPNGRMNGAPQPAPTRPYTVPPPFLAGPVPPQPPAPALPQPSPAVLPPPALPPARPYHGPHPPHSAPPSAPASRPPAAPTFRSSWTAPAVRAGGYGLLALLAADTADPESGSSSATVRLIAFIAFIWLAIVAVRWFIRVLRPRSAAEVSADGLSLRIGRSRWRLPWSAVVRVRIIDSGRRPMLVVWALPGITPPGAFGAVKRRYYGGVKVLPVAHGHLSKRRMREVLELRAALAWYGRPVYDSSP